MTRTKLFILFVAAVAVALVPMLAACSSPGAPVAPTVSAPASGTAVPATSTTPPITHAEVTIVDFAFKPDALSVRVGAVVTWKNTSKSAHVIAFDDGSITSPKIGAGQTATHVFKTVGSFGYHDPTHPSMKGTVVVTK